jgi:hypothetical protein
MDWTMGNSSNCSDALFAAYGPPLAAANISGVVVMHASPIGFGNCPQALHRVIAFWKKNGYTFDTVGAGAAGDMLIACVLSRFQPLLTAS